MNIIWLFNASYAHLNRTNGGGGQMEKQTYHEKREEHILYSYFISLLILIKV